MDENPKALKRMVTRLEIPWPQICDGKGMAGELVKLFDVEGMPSYYILNRQGKLVAKGYAAKDLAKVVAKVLRK